MMMMMMMNMLHSRNDDDERSDGIYSAAEDIAHIFIRWCLFQGHV